jgi:hypothetical protein
MLYSFEIVDELNKLLDESDMMKMRMKIRSLIKQYESDLDMEDIEEIIDGRD